MPKRFDEISVMSKNYQLKDFDYNLPKELIAQEPVTPRDHSRLLVLDKKSGKIEHEYFYDLPDHLRAGDVLVMNNSKVFPARLIGKKTSGGRIEVFLHRYLEKQPLKGCKALQPFKGCSCWQVLLGGRGARVGQKVFFEQGLECEVIKDNNDGTWEAEFNLSYVEMMKIVEQIGQVPLPPYIHRNQESGAKKQEDKERYQTVYADEEKRGSVAAPTAGLHFTPELLKKLKKKGIEILYITLHVGLGTFAPVKIEDFTKHKMHSEYVEIDADVIRKIIEAKKNNRRVIAVGTTSARSLEAAFQTSKDEVSDFTGWVNIFIYPGYEFKVLDGMITNFHLPKSTLVMLVSALAGKGNIDKAYESAIKHKYRFYSYGDAMLII